MSSTELERSDAPGRHVRVSTNMFIIKRLPRKTFYHYNEITIGLADGSKKEVKTPLRMREIVDRLRHDNPRIFLQSPAYDGKKNMYTSFEIRQENFTVKMSRNPNSNRGIFNVRLQRVSRIDPQQLKILTTAEGLANPAATAVCTNLLQVIVSQAPNLKHQFALHSKSFFMENAKAAKLSGGLEAWRGFFQSVRPVLNNIVINVDTTTAAIYTPGELIAGAMAHLDCGQGDVRTLIQKCANDTNIRRLRTFYKGVMVQVPGKQRGDKIDDIVPRAGEQTFPKGGDITSVAEHFKSTYNISLRYPDAFGVRIGKTAIYPAEVCTILPGQIYKKKLDGQDTSIMIKASTVRPNQRLKDIQRAVADDSILGYKSSPFILDAEMEVETQPIVAPGRVIDPPQVMYAGNQRAEVRGGAWNVTRVQFVQPARIPVWAVVNFDTSPRSAENVERFARTLLQNMKNLGIAFQREQPVFLTGNQMRVQDSLQEAADKAVNSLPKRTWPGLVLAVLPANAGPLRKEVKQWGDMRMGVSTQCVRAGKYESAKDQYCNNVALKINARAGGVNSVINFDGQKFLGTCMVVGCDVAHPSPGVKGRPSIASLVASVDESVTRYHSELSLQPPRQETIDSLGRMVRTAINAYFKQRKEFPENIVVYRDGVSEGEYAQLERGEIKDIQDQLDDMQRHTGRKPNLIFIVVGKRHHVRFFPMQRGDEDRSGNAHAGLVVDREVVHSKYTDFYLQSQGGLLGTSRPSHYIVLRNQAGLTAYQLQELSFALCHVYASATRSVSIPAPVYYADRLCARAEFHFQPGAVHFEESDGASSASGDDFDMAKWQKAFGQSKLNESMHFL